MTTNPRIIDGRAVAGRIAERLSSRVRALGRAPKLVVVRVGDDPRSTAYISRKVAFGESVGAVVTVRQLPLGATQAELEVALAEACGDPAVDGVILQLPAANLDGYAAAALVSPEKDVDGLAPNSPFVPATARGVLELLDECEVALRGRPVTVVGRSHLVGAPVASLLRARGAQVSVACKATPVLADVTRSAAIVVSAAGVPGLLGPRELRDGAIVIDVGTTPGPDGKLLGDLAPEARAKLAAYSPVPGGVGPMTVAALIQNLLDAAERRG